jgi:hypothetical protein
MIRKLDVLFASGRDIVSGQCGYADHLFTTDHRDARPLAIVHHLQDEIEAAHAGKMSLRVASRGFCRTGG